MSFRTNFTNEFHNQNTFSSYKPQEKLIGLLTIEERNKKIQKYLEKKKRRKWTKRVSYNCRKVLAEKRFRIKGRFVSKQQMEQFQASHSLTPKEGEKQSVFRVYKKRACTEQNKNYHNEVIN